MAPAALAQELGRLRPKILDELLLGCGYCVKHGPSRHRAHDHSRGLSYNIYDDGRITYRGVYYLVVHLGLRLYGQQEAVSRQAARPDTKLSAPKSGADRSARAYPRVLSIHIHLVTIDGGPQGITVDATKPRNTVSSLRQREDHRQIAILSSRIKRVARRVSLHPLTRRLYPRAADLLRR